MKLLDKSFDNIDELINLYKNRSLKELQKITPKWAYGENHDKSLNLLNEPNNERYTTYIVKTNELIRKSEFNEVDLESLFTDESLNNKRIARLLFHWENNRFVDPPEVFISLNSFDRLQFSDGRHRTKLTYFLECKEIPIILDKSDIKYVKKMINIRSI